MKHVSGMLLKSLLSVLLLTLLAAVGWSPAIAQERTVCVTAARANLRTGPGTDFRISWEVNRYMPLIQVGKKGRWLRVKDVDGDLHWVFETLVNDKVDCVTVRSEIANIRKRPTTSSEKWFTVQKYTSFRMLGQREKWVQITYEKESMWVYHSLVWPLSS